MIENNMINGISLIVDLPYPKINNYEIEENTLNKIRSIFSGIKSELTCILNYSYIASLYNKNEEIHRLYEAISITEMKHYSLLSDFITNSKNKPCIGFKNNSGNFEPWNSSFINYEQGLIKIINNNIETELDTIKKYRDIISSSKNNDLNKLIGRIILDEERHIELLSSVKRNLI